MFFFFAYFFFLLFVEAHNQTGNIYLWYPERLAPLGIIDDLKRVPWNPSPQELKLASFHELASVNKLADGLNTSLIVRPFFEGYTRHFRQSICEVKQTLTTGVHESSWNSCDKHERKARVDFACELVYVRKLVKAREFSQAADDLQFLKGDRYQSAGVFEGGP